MKTVEERLEAIETAALQQGLCPPNLLGTSLMRVYCINEKRQRWTLGIGALSGPKKWFTADTVDTVLRFAEQFLLLAK
jgi:hypothetical protein